MSILKWFLDIGYTEFALSDGQSRSIMAMYNEIRFTVSRWSMEKAQSYMQRSQNLLPDAPNMAINYLDTALEFPELPIEVAKDIKEMRTFATELLKNKKREFSVSLDNTGSIEQQINNLSRRLQKLREIQALKGIDTEPHYLIEIEDIEEKLEWLQQLDFRQK